MMVRAIRLRLALSLFEEPAGWPAPLVSNRRRFARAETVRPEPAPAAPETADNCRDSAGPHGPGTGDKGRPCRRLRSRGPDGATRFPQIRSRPVVSEKNPRRRLARADARYPDAKRRECG